MSLHLIVNHQMKYLHFKNNNNLMFFLELVFSIPLFNINLQHEELNDDVPSIQACTSLENKDHKDSC
jgi:hypothetical protein